MSNISP